VLLPLGLSGVAADIGKGDFISGGLSTIAVFVIEPEFISAGEVATLE
jgi:hypothetical protein